MGGTMQPGLADQRKVLRVLRTLRALALLTVLAALLLGMFLPVYTDEIGWRFQERAGFDGVDKMFNDSCGPNSLSRPPWFMWPVRLFSAVFNSAFADPFYVRLSGVGYALLWITLLALLIGRLARDARTGLVAAMIGFGLLALANTPFLLLLSRPEQPIILCVTVAALLATHRQGDEVEPPHRFVFVRPFAVVALAGIALSYHLKSLFLLPLFVACALLASRGRATLAPRLIAAGAIIALNAAAASYWISRLQCPDDALLRAEYARNSIGALLGNVHDAAGVLTLIGRLITNIGIFRYLMAARPEPSPLSFWLAHGQVTPSAALAWTKALYAVWSATLLLALTSFALAGWRAWCARWLDGRLVVAAMLFVAVLGWSATQLISNFYEGGFILPLLTLAIVHAIAAGTTTRSLRTVGVILGSALALAAPVSLAISAHTWAPSLSRAWHQSGYVAEQPFSLSIRGYGRAAERVRVAARACAIPPPYRAHGLVIDELTYFPYMRARLPQHWLGLFGGWRGSVVDPVAYLRRHRSDGVLVDCRHLPPSLRARAHDTGGVCCLAPPGW